MIGKHLLLIFVGGGIGACLRYALTVAIPSSQSTFPWATFIANLVGCFLIGAISGWLLKSQLYRSDLTLLLITGFCGGFTTFSTFSHESLGLLKSDQIGLLILYSASSLIFGIILVGIGYFLIK